MPMRNLNWTDAEAKVADIKKPEWTVSVREDSTDYVGYRENAERMANIAKVFPAMFFLVAALISLTTMTRMVEEERTQIGTLKALGYGKASIAMKYLLYALLATLGGSIAGALFGQKFLPFVIIQAYGIIYQHMNVCLTPYQADQPVWPWVLPWYVPQRRPWRHVIKSWQEIRQS